jgi:hypothetical protein
VWAFQAVLETFVSKTVTQLKGDWTDVDPAVTEATRHAQVPSVRRIESVLSG